MLRVMPSIGVALLSVVIAGSLSAQDRVTPKAAKGGEKQGEPWTEVPETFRGLRIPELAAADGPEALAANRSHQDP